MGASGVGADCKNGKVLDDKRTLRVEGLPVDRIEQVIALHDLLDEGSSKLQELEHITTTAMHRKCRLEPNVAPLVEQFKQGEPLWKILVSNKSFLSGYEAAPASYQDQYEEVKARLLRGPGVDGGDQDTPINSYERWLRQSITRRSVFITDSGFVGTCIPDARKDDEIVILFGSPVPFVLRPLGVRQYEGVDRVFHALVGASYTGGIMNGEMVDFLYCDDLADSVTYLIE